jgi:8-hydroxy-5-deazaflavin:NADPH oxidoreductase
MNIAILGTGAVGRALAAGMAGAGHEVRMGTRDPEATLARTEPDRFGQPPLRDWLEARAGVQLVTFAQAAAAAEMVVNATSGDVSLAVLRAAGADHLAGKVLVDVSNPLDFSGGFPPSLFVKDTDSLGEQIQRAFPEARVVKSLNTMTAGLMLDPGRLSAPTAVFLSGDDAAAKQQVHDLLAGFGWEQIVDLGGIQTARGVEMLLPMWLQLMGVFGDPEFNWSIVR